MARPKLTVKQEKFAQALLLHDNKSDAYRSAFNADGMAGKTINEAASRLAKNSKVIARVKELRDRAEAAADVSRDRIVRELARIAFADKVELMLTAGKEGLDKLTPEQAAIISEIEIKTEGAKKKTVKVRTYDKSRALDMLNKMLGNYSEHNKQKAPVIENLYLKELQAAMDGG